MNTRNHHLLATALFLTLSLPAGADVIDNLQKSYLDLGATAFSAERGQQLWQQTGKDNNTCATCHGEDLRQAGKHVRTFKLIEPMAPSTNAMRYRDAAKVEKWFLRNCKWTWARECTAQEKGDLLQYLRTL